MTQRKLGFFRNVIIFDYSLFLDVFISKYKTKMRGYWFVSRVPINFLWGIEAKCIIDKVVKAFNAQQREKRGRFSFYNLTSVFVKTIPI